MFGWNLYNHLSYEPCELGHSNQSCLFNFVVLYCSGGGHLWLLASSSSVVDGHGQTHFVVSNSNFIGIILPIVVHIVGVRFLNRSSRQGREIRKWDQHGRAMDSISSPSTESDFGCRSIVLVVLVVVVHHRRYLCTVVGVCVVNRSQSSG